MKEWLKENLIVNMTIMSTRSPDYNLKQKLSLREFLITGLNIDLNISIAGETITRTTSSVDMESHEKAFQTLANVAENCMIQITKLQTENQELRKRIESLEHPLPV